jgi:hypothetical protein
MPYLLLRKKQTNRRGTNYASEITERLSILSRATETYMLCTIYIYIYRSKPSTRPCITLLPKEYENMISFILACEFLTCPLQNEGRFPLLTSSRVTAAFLKNERSQLAGNL